MNQHGPIAEIQRQENTRFTSQTICSPHSACHHCCLFRRYLTRARGGYLILISIYYKGIICVCIAFLECLPFNVECLTRELLVHCLPSLIWCGIYINIYLTAVCVYVQDLLMEREDAVEEILLGLVSQIAEADDIKIVEDLQSKYIIQYTIRF